MSYLTENNIRLAIKKDITLGDASILTVISGNNVEEFKINILKVMQNEKSKKIFYLK